MQKKDSQITLTQAQKLIRTKKHMYNAMIRNQWYLPHYKSSIITLQYMQHVREQKYWCPKYSDLKPKACPTPPSKEKLMDIAVKLCEEKEYDIGAFDKKIPDKAWLLQVIAILDPDCIIFNKDYLPPIHEIKKADMNIDNNDDFFTDLPELRRKECGSRSSLPQFKIAKYQSRINRLKDKKAQLEFKLQLQADKLDQVNKGKQMVKVSLEEFNALKDKLKTYGEEKLLQSTKKPHRKKL